MTDPMKELLGRVARGELDAESAAQQLRGAAISDLGFARLDLDREARCGFPEVILSEGKRPEQVAKLFREIATRHGRALATRADPAVYEAVQELWKDVEYHELARTLTWQRDPPLSGGRVAVVAAGTSDLPVAEEARITAQMLGADVITHYDVGVAGLHRLLGVVDELRTCRALVVVAGMEGALPSVVAGQVNCPVIGVPTSVGYGVSLAGIAALLAMLNSCAAGVSVVNIDNGFGAGYIAAQISRESTRDE